MPCRRLLQALPQPKDVLAQRHHRRAPRRLNTSLLEKRFQARHLRLEEQALLRVPADLLHLLVRRRKLAPGPVEIPLQHPCMGAGGSLRPGQLLDTCLQCIRTDPLLLVQRLPVRRLAGHNRGRQTQSVAPFGPQLCRPRCLVVNRHGHDNKRGEIPLPVIYWHCLLAGPNSTEITHHRLAERLLSNICVNSLRSAICYVVETGNGHLRARREYCGQVPRGSCKERAGEYFWGHQRFLNEVPQFPNLGVVGSNPAGRTIYFQ